MEEHIANFSFFTVLILVAISGIFSCCETSITAVSRARVHRMINEGDKRAKRLEKLLKKRESVISTMLIGNNIVNILASSLATTVLIAIFGDSGVIYATVIMTVLVVIFAEIAPKTLALKMPDKIAISMAWVMDLLVKILFPLTHVSQKLVDGVFSLFFAKSKRISREAEMEEIRDTIDLKHKEGSIVKYDKDLIDGVLDLADTEISEIMVHRKEVESINMDLSVDEIVKRALEIPFTRIPLWRGNRENIVAILNVRKLLKFIHINKGSLGKFKLEMAISEPWFVPSTNSLRAQLFAFRKKKKRFCLVVDEYGSLLGLLTLEDILEEIVGDIKEQEDESEINIIKIKSGAYKIAGKTLIRDINKKLDWEILEGDHAYNLTAFVINKLGRIPEERENFLIDEYYFEILKRKNNDLILMKVRKVKNAPVEE
jgi:Mg2+/Co2+ transporter CorB